MIYESDRRVLLRLALGRYEERREYRFRHMVTGETRESLDAREHDFAEWGSEERTVIETSWVARDGRALLAELSREDR